MKQDRHSLINLSKEEFKQAGHQLVDEIADFLHSLPDRPVTYGDTPENFKQLVKQDSLPEEGRSSLELLREAAALLFNHSLFNGHPKFLGYITSSPAPLGMLADLLATAVNPNVGAYILSPAATEIEKQTIQWLAQFIGLEGNYGGVLVSGGNMANFTGFLAGRTAKSAPDTKQAGISREAKMLIYCSAATHTWIEKAAVLFGLGTNAIRWIPTDEKNRMNIDNLEQKIKEDIGSGFKPIMIIGTAGDVSTGAVDDLRSLASISKQFDLWFHIDGAYGLPAAVIPSYKSLFDGIQEADSIAIDPHKWLYAPLEAGCTLVKDPNTLIHTFSSHPVYYNFDTAGAEHATNFYEFGLQNSRGFRALKVWLTLQQVGRSGYETMINEDIEISKRFFEMADAENELEAVSQSLSITTLRYVPVDTTTDENQQEFLNTLNTNILNTLQREGRVFLSNAVIEGKYCLRACMVNFRTSLADMQEIINIIIETGRKERAGLQGFQGVAGWKSGDKKI
jgi:aromatic-L-amino-acid/L-tryptophan decarboxylase